MVGQGSSVVSPFYYILLGSNQCKCIILWNKVSFFGGMVQWALKVLIWLMRKPCFQKLKRNIIYLSRQIPGKRKISRDLIVSNFTHHKYLTEKFLWTNIICENEQNCSWWYRSEKNERLTIDLNCSNKCEMFFF